MNSVIQFGKVDTERIQEVVEELSDISAARQSWVRAYSEYQSGGWWTLSLIGGSKDSRDVVLKDVKGVATQLLDHLPATQRLISETDIPMLAVRLAKMEPGACLYEHRDHEELPHAGDRVHIPLTTNESCIYADADLNYHMGVGGVYRIEAKDTHAACNFGDTDRIHLIIDTYQWTPQQDVQVNVDGKTRKSFSRNDLEEMKQTAGRLIHEEGVDRAADQVLRWFFEFDFERGQIYDLLAETLDSNGHPLEAGKWRDRKITFLGSALQNQKVSS